MSEPLELLSAARGIELLADASDAEASACRQRAHTWSRPPFDPSSTMVAEFYTCADTWAAKARGLRALLKRADQPAGVEICMNECQELLAAACCIEQLADSCDAEALVCRQRASFWARSPIEPSIAMVAELSTLADAWAAKARGLRALLKRADLSPAPRPISALSTKREGGR